MKPALRLPPQNWMTAPATLAVVKALAAEGAEVRFVGGCVRDAVIGRAVKDIDLATQLPPERVTALLERAGIKVVPTGIKHGTVTAVAGAAHFEITTLRRDVETYGRHAKVEFTDDWTADASRRDFTMNAVFLAMDGTLFDPFGGIDDLKRGRVRFVGDAQTRIREDVLRLLRFFRFHAHYGKGQPDEEALAAAGALAPMLPTLSGERVAAETLKLLLAPDPASVLGLMRAADVLRHFLPEAVALERLARLVAIEQALGAEPNATLRLAALIEASGPAAEVAKRLRLSNRERDDLVGWSEGPELSPAEGEQAVRAHLYRLGARRYRGLALVAWAVSGAPVDSAPWRALAAMADHPVPIFPLKGRDGLRLGLDAGPRLGQALAAVEAWWIDGDFQADRQACLDKLRTLAIISDSI
jgi:poly(A) polymerase